VTQRFRVLVVDDNQDNADTIAWILRQWYYQVEAVYDGEQALETAAKFHPDAVISDIRMPGLDGFGVARRLRSMPETKDILLISISAFGSPEMHDESSQAGFDCHFQKPVQPLAIHQLFEARQGNNPAS
jgi:two-component system CheB/CheR fusion protein